MIFFMNSQPNARIHRGSGSIVFLCLLSALISTTVAMWPEDPESDDTTERLVRAMEPSVADPVVAVFEKPTPDQKTKKSEIKRLALAQFAGQWRYKCGCIGTIDGSSFQILVPLDKMCTTDIAIIKNNAQATKYLQRLMSLSEAQLKVVWKTDYQESSFEEFQEELIFCSQNVHLTSERRLEDFDINEMGKLVTGVLRVPWTETPSSGVTERLGLR